MHNKEPGVFLIISSLAMALGGVCFGLYPVTQSVVIRQFGLLFVGGAVLTQILYSTIGNAPQKSNVVLSLLGGGMVRKLVYFALGLSAVCFIIGIVLQSSALAVFAQSCFWVVLGLVGLVVSIVWHANNSSLERNKVVAARVLLCVCLGALTVSILEPVVVPIYPKSNSFACTQNAIAWPLALGYGMRSSAALVALAELHHSRGSYEDTIRWDNM